MGRTIEGITRKKVTASKIFGHDECLYFGNDIICLTYVDDLLLFGKDKKQVDNRIHVKIRANKSSDVNELLKAIVNQVQVISVHELTPSMNDIFIQKVQEVMPEVLEEQKEASDE